MKHKQKYLILIIIIIGIFICLTIKKEKLVVNINEIGNADLTNDIATVGGDDEELKNNVFLNILGKNIKTTYAPVIRGIHCHPIEYRLYNVNNQIEGNSMMDCINKCNSIEECDGFDLIRSQNMCWLKKEGCLGWVTNNQHVRSNNITFFKKNKMPINLNNPPKIIFKSYESCPTLYSIFNGLRAHNNSKQENTKGIEFRNKCESIFYNSDRFVLIEHNIIDLRSEKFNISGSEQMFNFSNFEFNVGGTNNIKYIDMDYKKESDMSPITPGNEKDSVQINNSFTQTAKNVNFGVKSNFQLEDVYRFIDYCYTCVCYAMIHIDYLTLTGNHYRVYPCPNPSHGEGSYFILPERIRKQVQEEGKSYTRAKCNSCGLNIIVSFGKFPRKFKHLVNINKTQLDHNTGNSFIRENANINLI